MTAPDRSAGFSLIEVLIAVFVFALVATLSVSVLSAGVRGAELNASVHEQTEAIDRLRIFLRDDLGQLAVRAHRDRSGRDVPYLFTASTQGRFHPTASDGERVLLSFSRAAADNPTMFGAQGGLYRVSYVLREGRLIRRIAAHPDLGPAAHVQETVLLTRVDDVTVASHDGRNWASDYALSVASTPSARDLPGAVRLRYSLPRLGTMEHVLLTSREVGG